MNVDTMHDTSICVDLISNQKDNNMKQKKKKRKLMKRKNANHT